MREFESVSFSLSALGLQFSERGLRSVTLAKNSLLDWIYALGTALLVWLVVRTLHRLLLSHFKKHAEKTVTAVDDVMVQVASATGFYFHLALALLVGREFLVLGPIVSELSKDLIWISILLQLGVWAQRGVGGAVDIWQAKQSGPEGATIAGGIRFVLKLIVWTLIVLLALANLGVEISAVIAGLGVGGIAAALAVQSILGDLFAGLSMYFDRPFDIGDFIQVDQLRGTVDRIGLRTTRIVSLDGEQIVLPNGELGKSRIRNFARMKERRVLFGFGVEYGLKAELLMKAKEIATQAVVSKPGVRLDRVHFRNFGASALEFELVYFVLSPDQLAFLDVHQEILLEIYRHFEEAGIPFAFPTQTLHLRKDS